MFFFVCVCLFFLSKADECVRLMANWQEVALSVAHLYSKIIKPMHVNMEITVYICHIWNIHMHANPHPAYAAHLYLFIYLVT